MNNSHAFAEPVGASDATSAVPSPAQPHPASAGAVNVGRRRSWPDMLRAGVARLQLWLRSLGPYVVIELLLPGGTIVALALWAYRQRRGARGTTIPARTEAPVQPRVPVPCVTPCPQR